MLICGSNNKNSIQLYEYFNNEKEFVFVMELCDENLLGLLKREKKVLNENELYNILIQLNNTFKIMSEKNIVHGSLKLENIHIKYDKSQKTKYCFKIEDYGVRRIVDSFSKKTSSTFDGTPPEISEGENMIINVIYGV